MLANTTYIGKSINPFAGSTTPVAFQNNYRITSNLFDNVSAAVLEYIIDIDNFLNPVETIIQVLDDDGTVLQLLNPKQGIFGLNQVVTDTDVYLFEVPGVAATLYVADTWANKILRVASRAVEGVCFADGQNYFQSNVNNYRFGNMPTFDQSALLDLNFEGYPKGAQLWVYPSVDNDTVASGNRLGVMGVTNNYSVNTNRFFFPYLVQSNQDNNLIDFIADPSQIGNALNKPWRPVDPAQIVERGNSSNGQYTMLAGGNLDQSREYSNLNSAASFTWNLPVRSIENGAFRWSFDKNNDTLANNRISQALQWSRSQNSITISNPTSARVNVSAQTRTLVGEAVWIDEGNNLLIVESTGKWTTNPYTS